MKRTTPNREKGIALLMALFAVMLLSAVGFAMLYSMDTETLVNANYRDQQRAYMAARGGLEEARQRLRPGVGGAVARPTALPAAANAQVIYLVNWNTALGENSGSVQPWVSTNGYVDRYLVNERFSGLGQGSSVSSPPLIPSGNTWAASAGAASAELLGSELKWVRIHLKANYSSRQSSCVDSTVCGNDADKNRMVCTDGLRQVAIAAGTCAATGVTPYPVYVLTALAQTPRTNIRRIMQMEATSLRVPPPPSALTLNGPIPNATFVDFQNSNNWRINGNDTGTTCTPSTTNRPAVGTSDDPSDTIVSGVVPRPDHYTGGSYGTPSVSNVSSLISGSAYETPAALELLVRQLSEMNTRQFTSNTSVTGISWGSSSSPEIVFAQGNLEIGGNSNGSGILIVQGDLTMSGNFSWNGLILAVGTGRVIMSGGGNGELRGAVFVANTRDNLGRVLNTFGQPTFDGNGGGGNGIFYDSCVLNNAFNNLGLMPLAVREVAP